MAASALSYPLLLILPAFLLSLDRYYHDPAVARDDYRSIAAYINADCRRRRRRHSRLRPAKSTPSASTIMATPPVYPLPRTRPLDADATRAELDRLLARPQPHLRHLLGHRAQADPDGVIESYLAENAFKAWDSWVGNLRFVAYSAAPPPAPTPFISPPRFGDAITARRRRFQRRTRFTPGEIAQVLLRWSERFGLSPPNTTSPSNCSTLPARSSPRSIRRTGRRRSTHHRLAALRNDRRPLRPAHPPGHPARRLCPDPGPVRTGHPVIACP